ncbi:MAG: hypothetical protein GX158_02720 [Bacteroidales bacterium]|jgi:hypothetical protein|nr:hypothetical protein [Bacteroidales bacterium]
MHSGYIKKSLFLLGILFITPVMHGQTGKNCTISFRGEKQENDVVVSARSIRIDYSIPEINLREFKNDKGSFYRIHIPGHTQTSETGSPELPVFSKLITIPAGHTYSIRITDVEAEKIDPGKKNIEGVLFPAQESESKASGNTKQQFSMNKTMYAKREFISSDTVSIASIGTIRGKNIASLLISPVRYNPHLNVVEAITSMKIEIRFSGTGTASKTYPESTVFRKTLEKGILNYAKSSDLPVFSEKPLRMVILTDTAFRHHLEPLIRWKTIKGFRIDVLYRGAEYAGQTYKEIKNSLTDLYYSSTADNPPPEYLLIVGNTSKIPYYGKENVTDLYYGEFDGNGDYFPEMFIGRLPVADTNELKGVVDKIIRYEKFEYADSNRFHSNAMITSGHDASYADYMNGQIKYVIENYLNEENNINGYHFYYPQTPQSAHKESVISLINQGLSFVNYTGHGSSTAWLHINIDTSDVRKLRNTNMYPFIISNACQTSQFNINSLGNRMVLAREKGAIGFIGCSNDSYWNEDFYWAVGACTPSSNPTYETTGLGAFDRLFHTHGEARTDWYTTMGQIVYSGNMSVSESTTWRKKYYWETYNLVGDPSMIPIIGTPDTFRTILPDTLPNGIKSWTFMAEPGSYVAISNSGSLWDASHTKPSGSITLKFPGVSDDSCLVVMTGQNKIPLIKTIYFSNVARGFLNLAEAKINDTSGNNDGKADFGENLSVDLKIANLGLTDSKNLYAKISSSSEYITLTSDSVMIGDLPAGHEITVNNKLLLKVSENIVDKSLVTLDIILKDEVETRELKIDFYIHAPDLDILGFYLNDEATGNGDQVANPGETFHLVFSVKNDGSSSTSGKFSLSSTDPEISILEPGKNSGILQDGVLTEIPVLVQLSPSVKSGTTITVKAVLNCGPYTVEKDFTFRVGRIRESFEGSSFSVFPWINISPRPWTITDAGSTDGNLSARSGIIGHNESSSLIIKTYYDTPDTLKFHYTVSSEPNYDYFAFYLNDEELLRKSGEIPWQRKVIPVPAGYNKFEWRYKKDQSVSQGRDCAMLDMIDFAGPGGVTYIERDLVTERIISPVQKDKPGWEKVIVKMVNESLEPIHGFNLAYSLNGGMPVRQHFTDTLSSFGDSVLVKFDVYANLARYGVYDLVIYSYDNNDNCQANDTLRINIENINIDEPLLVKGNPFADKLVVEINAEAENENDDRARISLFNSQGGKLIDIEENIHPGTNEITIRTEKLLPGHYYLRVDYAGRSRAVPVIKARR